MPFICSTCTKDSPRQCQVLHERQEGLCWAWSGNKDWQQRARKATVLYAKGDWEAAAAIKV